MSHKIIRACLFIATLASVGLSAVSLHSDEVFAQAVSSRPTASVSTKAVLDSKPVTIDGSGSIQWQDPKCVSLENGNANNAKPCMQVLGQIYDFLGWATKDIFAFVCNLAAFLNAPNWQSWTICSGNNSGS